MVQRGFCIATAFEIADKADEEDESLSNAGQDLLKVPPTNVKVFKIPGACEKLLWLRGDIPVFREKEVLFGIPPILTVQDSTVVLVSANRNLKVVSFAVCSTC